MEQILSRAHEKMRKALEISKNDLSSIRSGRATPALVEHMVIAAYGGSQHLKLMEMATITTMDAKTLVIAPYDPSVIVDIEKGILEANTGLTPVIDGEIIRISIPPLSEERRLEYIKLAKAKLESGRVMIRQIRQEAMHGLTREADAKTISEDQQKHGERLVQELTDEMVAEIDALGKKKEEELLQV
ncbi:ribosome recycling factor [Candidatus Gottesmanbacteria bacterium RBG_13_45_10]|uniref:Ribosome-recycling factor n=1 Tax=Candidatus Gottesmanbacteria bacterium RBG_13_45_10 TaxID=1798370 RepID=A0A1F5ZGU8_9BACT|nr:MAG: ribosome recycling factor [Candidatus Gottesmanbacteria bacterium RBG_13_45_10]